MYKISNVQLSTKRSPLVCVCVPAYNASSTITETLHSILDQSYKNIIVKVIDNASTDDTVAKVKKNISDTRVSVFVNNENIGGENNFTRCIEMSEGEYTCIFHADDVYHRHLIEYQVSYLESNPKSGAVFSDAFLINENGVRIGCQGNFGRVKGEGITYNLSQIFKGILKYSNFFICPSAMMRTKICRNEIMIWNGSAYKTSADLDVWLRILKSHEIGILPNPLIDYRISNNQGSVDLRGRVDRADMFLVIDDYLRKSFIAPLLSKDDLRNYNRLDRTDRVIRAMNLYLRGDKSEARILIRDFFILDSFLAAATSYRGLATLIAALAVKIFIELGINEFGVLCIKYFKKISNR